MKYEIKMFTPIHTFEYGNWKPLLETNSFEHAESRLKDFLEEFSCFDLYWNWESTIPYDYYDPEWYDVEEPDFGENNKFDEFEELRFDAYSDKIC